MNESRQPVTRQELDEALQKALERHVTKDEFGGFVQLFMQEQKRSAETLSAMEHRLMVGIRGEMAAREERLMTAIRGDMTAQEERLMVEIGRAARVAAEEHRREIGVLDDRYRDLPRRVDALERGLREHIEDAAAHGRRPRRPTRRR
jgi:hypothetical protein